MFRKACLSIMVSVFTATVVFAQSSVTADAHPIASPASPNVDVKTGDSTTTSAFRIFNSTPKELLRVRGDGVLVLGGATGSQWDPALLPAIEYIDTSIAFGSDTDLHFASNAYASTSGPWRYKTSDLAADYYLYKGGFGWRVAPAGTAGSALSWVTAMLLTNAGNLGVGTTAPRAMLHLARNAAGTVGPELILENNANAVGDAEVLTFAANGVARAQIRSRVEGSPWYGTLEFNTGLNTPLERMRINGAGDVGIGTAAPNAKLHVVGNTLVTGNLSVSGAITGATVIGATYQDLAEWVPATSDMAPGTVVILNPDHNNEVMQSSDRYDVRVAGVVSEQPGLILGIAGASKEQIATTGRVRVKVDATAVPIRIGDLLVTSDNPGMAMRSLPLDLGGVPIHRPGTIIGKALEPLAGGEGEILVLLSLQ